MDWASYIQTVPRRGYRFAAPLEAPAAARISLAVLPLGELGGDGESPLGLGMADALIGRFTGVERLIVRPTGSVLRYAGRATAPQQAGAELGVDAVLDGSLQRHEDRVRISLQLVPLRGGVAAWAERFDESWTNPFDVQDALAGRVARALLQHLDPAAAAEPNPARRYRAQPGAYEACLRGRLFWSRLSAENVQRAFACFQEAAELDPGYALPHAGLADAFLTLGFSGVLEPGEAWRRARDSAERALGLDAELAEAHVALGFVELFQAWDWRGARASLRRAVELAPATPATRQWHAFLLLIDGQADAARREIERARELDPLSLIATTLAAFVHAAAGEHARELELCRRAAEVDPGAFLAHWSLGLALVRNSQPAAAVRAHRRAVELADQAPFLKAALAWTLASTGEQAEARELSEQLERTGSVSGYQLAALALALGDRDLCLARLERACDERDPWVVVLGIDPLLEPLRDEPRYRGLLDRLRAER